MLSLAKVRAGYGETVVLEDIEFTLPERGALAVLGRNGVGKTTLLATIMGHTTFHSGEIIFQKKSVEKIPVYERSKLGIGYVPQARDIFPSLTLEENLAVAARRGAGNARWDLAAVYQLFPRLKERQAAMGNQLSGGEQQMLAIGRALMGNPSLLLLDEPLEGLAPIIVDSLLIALKQLVSDHALAMILVEQHAKIALQVTQDAVVLNRGRIAWSGPSAALLGDAPKLTALLMAQ